MPASTLARPRRTPRAPALLSALTAALTTLLATPPGQAATPPAPLYTFAGYGYDALPDVPFGSRFVTGPGSLQTFQANGSFAASANLGQALLQASMAVGWVDLGPHRDFATDAYAGLQYDFAVVASGGFSLGPPLVVPFKISGYVQADATGLASAVGSLKVQRSPADSGAVSPGALRARTSTAGCSGADRTLCGQRQAIEVAGSITPFYDGHPGVGEIARITLTARVAVLPYFGPWDPSSGSVVVDPTISIDPDFLTAHPEYSFSVVHSPLVGNVPEPASVALMLAGLGLVGAVARRRRAG